MSTNPEIEKWTGLARKAATDANQVKARYALAIFTAKTFTRAGDELFAIGHLLGPDRASGVSPGGHGNDEVVGVGMALGKKSTISL